MVNNSLNIMMVYGYVELSTVAKQTRGFVNQRGLGSGIRN